MFLVPKTFANIFIVILWDFCFVKLYSSDLTFPLIEGTMTYMPVCATN